jgi:hypothetical protein
MNETSIRLDQTEEEIRLHRLSSLFNLFSSCLLPFPRSPAFMVRGGRLSTGVRLTT